MFQGSTEKTEARYRETRVCKRLGWRPGKKRVYRREERVARVCGVECGGGAEGDRREGSEIAKGRGSDKLTAPSYMGLLSGSR